MPFHVRDVEINTLVRRLASRQQTGITDAIRLAVSNELKRQDDVVPLPDRIAQLSRKVTTHAMPPQQVDKAFFDELSGDRRERRV